ncbi:ATPase domain-containing protein [Pullulanibacillus sp. KACC 23026]|uniref:ATPase domain-containing protein n=1 Tax=Pullulanibacillus sp. KACC 23026 TaxID=3028315 RepID=UPI0023B16647|nr:ATPase domain-containing protein [Pullulanibacillus sp. KACC 23026]WEG12476.1 ATPase domain-containing protein [Pullulanibacillus sp. KACC 23026]
MQNITESGVAGIDKILYGGLPKGSAIIVEGAPGTGKTTLGVQFLVHGALKSGETGIYITFEEFPHQIYQDMEAFGWDLKKLEKQNLLRFISIKPEVLLEQMKQPNGLFEQLIQEINCQRVVVDSISLLQYIYKDQKENREALYNLRNILRKFSLTSMLLSERANSNSEDTFEHYVADGVIRLSIEEQMQKFRKRTLEVIKMRGRKIIEGEHIYRLTDKGIHLVPALSVVEDVLIKAHDKVSTGIGKLDQLLSGGITRGSTLLIDTNSKANYKYLIGSIITKRILEGDRIIAQPSSLTTIEDLQKVYKLYGVDLEEACKQDKMYFIEQYNREVPDVFKDNVLNVKDVSNEDYLGFLNGELTKMVTRNFNTLDDWFVFYDLSAIFSLRGPDFVKRIFAEESTRARTTGNTILALCNFSEIGKETSSFLERTSNGVIRTWVDGNYQYLQLTKSTSGFVSEPLLVETISEKPLIQLV